MRWVRNSWLFVQQWFYFLNGIRRGVIVHTRRMSEDDRAECYRWVELNCPRSLANPVWGELTHDAIRMGRDALRFHQDARARGLYGRKELDDCRTMYLYDPQERMLFKLTWGGQ